ncbi:hypothetical protein ACFSTC_41620 [Nonomuraea ferruginea]
MTPSGQEMRAVVAVQAISGGRGGGRAEMDAGDVPAAGLGGGGGAAPGDEGLRGQRGGVLGAGDVRQVEAGAGDDQGVGGRRDRPAADPQRRRAWGGHLDEPDLPGAAQRGHDRERRAGGVAAAGAARAVVRGVQAGLDPVGPPAGGAERGAGGEAVGEEGVEAGAVAGPARRVEEGDRLVERVGGVRAGQDGRGGGGVAQAGVERGVGQLVAGQRVVGAVVDDADDAVGAGAGDQPAG